MSWSLGFDDSWNRWIGYGVPAYCDYPKCNKEIDRGLSYVCGSDSYGGENGCGLYFCNDHLNIVESKIDKRIIHICDRCEKHKKPFKSSKEHPDWIKHLEEDESWEEWRKSAKGIEYLKMIKGV
jgi:hypothetical protein